MNFYFDECIPYFYADVLKAMPKEISHNIFYRTDLFPKGIKDLEWIEGLRKHGDNWTIITFDKKITRNPLEKRAIKDSGFILFVLKQKVWAKQNKYQQIGALMHYWPKIIEHCQNYRDKRPILLTYSPAGNSKLKPI